MALVSNIHAGVIASSNLYLYFGDGGAGFLIDSNATITNMKLTGFPNGTFQINGGITSIAQAAYTETVGVNLIVNTGGSLTDYGYNTLLFTNDGVQLSVYGTMQVAYGNGSVPILIDNGGNVDDFINVQAGTLSYLGTGVVTNTFKMPVQVVKGGMFLVTKLLGATNNGKLIVQGVVPGQSNKASVMMFDPTSSVQLAYGDTLECDNDYYQSDGTLKTTDNTTCTLLDRADGSGTATIAGGNLLVDSTPNTYGTFKINATNLNLAGKLVVSVQGYPQDPMNPTVGTSDLLNVTGTTNLQAGSTLKVYDYGQLGNGDFWVIIKDTVGNNIQGNFAPGITSVPQQNLNGGIDQNHKNQYLVSF